jgi:endonuclease YncB( thermonuclease family)
VDDAERIAMVHHLLIAAEEEAIAAKAPLSVNVSNALDLLVSDSPVTPGYIYRATGTRVVDGDTFIAAVDLGFRVTYSCIVRLHGINAPEKNKTGGQSAKAALEQLVLNRRLLLSSYKDERSFERWVCDVWNVEAGGSVNVADALIGAGKGVAFEKGDKWTRG